MSEKYEYEVLLAELRMELKREQVKIEKLEEDLEEKDDEISTLRQDYREAQEANERLEADVEDLNHELLLTKNEIKSWRKKKKSQVAKEILEENEQLKEKLRISKEKYASVFHEEKELVPEDRQSNGSAILIEQAPANEFQVLLEQMVQQYESEINILRTANEATVSGLQMQLENAIVDKEEIAESYILEIERLDLALTEAVNRISDLQQKYTNLKAALSPSSSGVRYRSLSQVTVNSPTNMPITLPRGKEVICSKVITRRSARISKPEKYQGLVNLQTIYGKWLFELVEDSNNDDQPQFPDIVIEKGKV